MIQTPEQFEAAMETATALLDQHPAEGTPAYGKLMALLKEIADYRPQVRSPAAAAPALAEERQRLAGRLDAFEARVTPHYGPHWSAMIGGNAGS